MVTILSQNEENDVAGGNGGGGELWIPAAETERVCGWAATQDGLTRGGVTAAVPAGKQETFVREGAVNLAAFWREMGRPALASAAGDVWVLGAGAEERAAALESLQAPDFTLPGLDGKLHSLSDFRGRKVFLASWASW